MAEQFRRKHKKQKKTIFQLNDKLYCMKKWKAPDGKDLYSYDYTKWVILKHETGLGFQCNCGKCNAINSCIHAKVMCELYNSDALHDSYLTETLNPLDKEGQYFKVPCKAERNHANITTSSLHLWLFVDLEKPMDVTHCLKLGKTTIEGTAEGTTAIHKRQVQCMACMNKQFNKKIGVNCEHFRKVLELCEGEIPGLKQPTKKKFDKKQTLLVSEGPRKEHKPDIAVNEHPIQYPLQVKASSLPRNLNVLQHFIPQYDESLKCEHGNQYDEADPVEKDWLLTDKAKYATRSDAYFVNIYYRPTIGKCDCTQKYDGHYQFVLNFQNKLLMTYQLLMSMHHILMRTQTTPQSMIESLNATNRDFGQLCQLDTATARRAYYSFLRLFDVDYNDGHVCRQCTEQDKRVIMIDGLQMGFNTALDDVHDPEDLNIRKGKTYSSMYLHVYYLLFTWLFFMDKTIALVHAHC